MDESLFRVINGGLSSPAMDWVMVAATSPESWIAPGLILAVGLIAKNKKLGAAAILSALLAVGLGDALAHQVIKPAVGRVRPCAALEGVRQPGGVGCTRSWSFPSNHAVNSAAIASAVGVVFPRTLLFLVPMAVLVGFSRIAVGVHYPSDVAVGLLLGGVIGSAVALSARRLAAGWLKEENKRDE